MFVRHMTGPQNHCQWEDMGRTRSLLFDLIMKATHNDCTVLSFFLPLCWAILLHQMAHTRLNSSKLSLLSIPKILLPKQLVERCKESGSLKGQGWDKDQGNLLQLWAIGEELHLFPFGIAEGTWSGQIHPSQDSHTVQYQGLVGEESVSWLSVTYS